MGKDTAGESFLLCKGSERRFGEMLVNSTLPSVKSCLGLGDLSSSLKRAVLEVIASGVVTSFKDVQEYTSCTLLAASQKEDESSDLDEPIAACIEFLKNNEFIKVLDGDRILPTSLGEACLSSSLPPDHALRLLAELYRARQCFVLDSELHIIYQVTPFTVSEQWRQLDWMSALAVWEGLSSSMQRVGELVGVEERFLIRAIRGNINTNSTSQMEKLSIFRRFYTALALQDLVNEVPLVTVAAKFKCTKGMLQSLQQSSSTFAGMVTQFCRRLGWSSMELLVSQFAERLQFGVQRELIDLLRMDCITALQARALYNAGIKNLSKLASAKVEKVEKALRKAVPFESDKVRNGNENGRTDRRCVVLAGRAGVTEGEAALLLINEAREFLQAELGLETAKWTEESSANHKSTINCSSNHHDSINSEEVEAQSVADSPTQFSLEVKTCIKENQAMVEQENVCDNKEDVFDVNKSTFHPNEVIKTLDIDVDSEKHEMESKRDNKDCEMINVSCYSGQGSKTPKGVNEIENIFNNDDSVNNQVTHRKSVDFFENSCEGSSSFNLEYTASPISDDLLPETENVDEHKNNNKNNSEENENQESQGRRVVEEDDVDMFEMSCDTKIVSMHDALTGVVCNSESAFLGEESLFQRVNLNIPTQKQNNISTLLESKNFSNIRLMNSNVDNLNSFDSTVIIPPSNSEYAFNADAEIISRSEETRPSEFPLSIVPVSHNTESTHFTTLRLNTPADDQILTSNTPTLQPNIIKVDDLDIFDCSPDCDNNLNTLNVALSYSSLDNMDSNWGGGSILESSMFLTAVSETTKRKLSFSEVDSAKQKKLRLSDNVSYSEKNEEKLHQGCGLNGELNSFYNERKMFDCNSNTGKCVKTLNYKESLMPQNMTAFYDSLDINSQLFTEIYNSNNVAVDKKHAKENLLAKDKIGDSENNTKEADDCKEHDMFDDIDMIVGTPVLESNILNRSNGFVRHVSEHVIEEGVKSRHNEEIRNKIADADIIAGTPVEKSDILHKSSVMNVSKCIKNANKEISLSNTKNVMHKLEGCDRIEEHKTQHSALTVIKSMPSKRCEKMPTSKINQREISEIFQKNGEVNIVAFNSKCDTRRKNSIFNNNISDSILETAAGFQTVIDFNETEIDNGNIKDAVGTKHLFSDHDKKLNKNEKCEEIVTSDIQKGSIDDGDDFVFSSQEDLLTANRSVCTRSMAVLNFSKPSTSKAFTSCLRDKSKHPAEKDKKATVSADKKHNISPSGMKFLSPANKKSQSNKSKYPVKKTTVSTDKKHQTCSDTSFKSPADKKFQSELQCITVEDVGTECQKLDKLKEGLLKRKTVAVGLHVVKRGEKRTEGIGVRILGKRTPPNETLGDFSSGSTVMNGMAVYWGGPVLYYLNLTKSSCPCVHILREFFLRSNVTVVMLNLKHQLKLLYECCKMDFKCQGSDPVVAEWMFTPHGRSRSLQQLMKINNIKCIQFDDDRPVIGDVIRVWQLHGHLEKKLKQAELLYSYKAVEMPIQFTLCRMEIAGFGFDREYAELLWARVEIKMAELQELAFQFSGRKFNLRSKAELNKVLQVLVNNSCDSDAQDALLGIVKKWCKLNTLKTKCLSPLLLETGSRLFGVCITCSQTGRVSMHEPNLQNVPKDIVIDDEVFSLRSAFLPSPGFILVSSDYCQLELRILAHLSEDIVLQKAFQSSSDIFVSIAASWHKIQEVNVTEELRQHTKQVCYGLIYGMGLVSLAEQMEVSENDASEMMQSFKEAYPTLQTYLSKVIAQCQATKQVRTVLNRVRYLPDILSRNPCVRSQAERQAVNTTVQGSAADIAKLGMLRVEAKLEEYCPGCNLVLHLHDEQIYEVPETHLERAVEIIRKEMVSAKQLDVPLTVRVKVGPSWGQLDPYL